MPQFHLGGITPTWYELDAFTQGYIEAMFFTNTGSSDDEDLEDASFEDLTQETLEHIRAECRRFKSLYAIYLEQAYERGYEPVQAGRDLWFTRNGHGVGFWDRKELEEDGLWETLSALCGWRTAWPERDLYRGDDGKVYLS